MRVVNAEAKILFHFQLPLPFNTTVKEVNCNLMVVNGSGVLSANDAIYKRDARSSS